MKLMVMVVVLGACYGTASAPTPVVAKNACPAPELSCKEAVETSSSRTKLRDRDVTLVIGICAQNNWSVDARKCVASAHSDDDLVACGKRFALGTRGVFADRASTKEAMTVMHTFEDEMCACKDSPCAQRVSDEMTKWGEEQARDNREPPKMSDEEVKQFTQIGEHMGKCMQKAMGGGTP
jgi:hypothetical protein